MHPLISAYMKLKELRNMAIRPWSPYYPVWQRMIIEQIEYIDELLIAEIERLDRAAAKEKSDD